MPLHVRRSSDPSLAALPQQEASAGAEEPPRSEPSSWSSTSSFQKHSLKVKPSSGSGSLERKVTSERQFFWFQPTGHQQQQLLRQSRWYLRSVTDERDFWGHFLPLASPFFFIFLAAFYPPPSPATVIHSCLCNTKLSRTKHKALKKAALPCWLIVFIWSGVASDNGPLSSTKTCSTLQKKFLSALDSLFLRLCKLRIIERKSPTLHCPPPPPPPHCSLQIRGILNMVQ